MSCRVETQTPRQERKTTGPAKDCVVLRIIAGTGSRVSCVAQEVTSRVETLPEPLSREAEESDRGGARGR